MPDWIRLVGDAQAVGLFGPVGGAERDEEVAGRDFAVADAGKGENEKFQFWTKQGIKVLTALLLVIGLVSIWFDDPARFTTAIGMVN